ncbi:putative lipoprotein [hydrothermal vent metagenome]|uniref:Putative lipoprotein n=1 Tax=hydrothermal vent metagenome TaxID=652676 RepID=A0A1W1C266_9ZZZZ
MNKFVIIWGFVVVAFINGCLAVSPDENTEEFMNSAIITSSVKARLANASGLETLSFTVETLNGAVLLSGFAQTQEQKDMAGKIANNTEGVQRVINHIVVQ